MVQVRRVRRIIRKIDPWTVLKVSIIGNAVLALAFVLGLVIFWSVLVSAGIPQKINEVAQSITLIDPGETLIDSGDRYFKVVIFLALVWTVLATGIMTLGAVVYNLISDIVGGVEIVVLEEILTVPASGTRQPARPAITTTPKVVSPEEADSPTKETAVVGKST